MLGVAFTLSVDGVGRALTPSELVFKAEKDDDGPGLACTLEAVFIGCFAEPPVEVGTAVDFEDVTKEVGFFAGTVGGGAAGEEPAASAPSETVLGSS